MIQALLNAFENDVSNCLVETDSELVGVYDSYDGAADQQRCYIKSEEFQPTHFELNNPLRANLFFAALDNCILQAHQQSRCDFLIGNFQKLYFVEIKQVKKGQRSLARSNAIEQLHSSITFFKGKINLTKTKLIAVICLKAKQVHPLQSATRVAAIVAFKERHDAELKEGQSDVF